MVNLIETAVIDGPMQFARIMIALDMMRLNPKGWLQQSRVFRHVIYLRQSAHLIGDSSLTDCQRCLLTLTKISMAF